jgi:hypothetical protein
MQREKLSKISFEKTKTRNIIMLLLLLPRFVNEDREIKTRNGFDCVRVEQ